MENNLKAFREATGLSQRRVADIFRVKYGKSSTTGSIISKWERGEGSPSVESALILAQIYNCKVEELFSLE